MWMKFTKVNRGVEEILQLEHADGRRVAVCCDEAGVTCFFVNKDNEVDACDPVSIGWQMNTQQDIDTHIERIYRNLKE